MSHIFLSYSHGDKILATQIRASLQMVATEVWQDIHYIEGGQTFWKEIETAIGQARCMLLLISQNSFNSDHVKRELEFAREKQIPVIPLLKGFRATGLPEWWQERLGSLHMLTVSPLTQSRKEAIVSAVEASLGTVCKTVALFNMKGGVGKTTLAAQLAARLNISHAKRVLLIDLDPQQNLTELCVQQQDVDERLQYNCTICGLFEPLQVGIEVSDANEFAIHLGYCETVQLERLIFQLNRSGKLPLFDIIPGDHRSIKYLKLADNSTLLENFNLAIKEARKSYDVIIFDCNPSVSFFTRAIMENTDFLLVPLRPDGFARRGVKFLQSVIERFYELERRPQVNAIFNCVSSDEHPRYEKRIIQQLREGIPRFFPGTEWLQGGYLKTEIAESPRLRPRTNLKVGDLTEDTSVLIANLPASEVEVNLRDFVNEYAYKIRTQGA